PGSPIRPSRPSRPVWTQPLSLGDIAPRYDAVAIGVAWIIRKDAVPDCRRNGGDVVVVDRAVAIGVACHAGGDERYEAIRAIDGRLVGLRHLVEDGDVRAGEREVRWSRTERRDRVGCEDSCRVLVCEDDVV